jgi:hypothetical protein
MKGIKQFNSLIDGKVEELTARINYLKTANVEDNTKDDYISPNTRSTQLNAKRRERDVLNLVKSLLTESTVLTEEQTALLVRLTTLSAERASVKYVFNEGDSIFELITKYEKLSRKDMEEKAAKQGLKLDFEKGIVVKA